MAARSISRFIVRYVFIGREITDFSCICGIKIWKLLNLQHILKNMTDIDKIKALIDANDTSEAIVLLDGLIDACPNCDELYFLRGNAYRKHNDWKHAMSDYCKAAELNPDSPAVAAYRAASRILDFYNKDLYNP